MSFYSFGLGFIFQRRMAVSSCFLPHPICTKSLCDQRLDIKAGGLIFGYNQWNENLLHMKRLWTIMRKICVLLIPLSLAFFQVNGVGDNFYVRTSALSSCISSSAGLFISNWYLIRSLSFTSKEIRREWVKASRSLRTKETTDFWVFISLPISCVARAIFFCLATIVFVTWTNETNVPSSQAMDTFVASALFLTCLMTLELLQTYRAIKWLCNARVN
ncbi:hypothetical protein GALMADRAFT_137782 [Galerina marginata CBS 339.88]|uniref:Transmembrane protein n=1 Tax=Galerina marginata (strain CBS 339.88) TaxID=685588 RepID=A0A067T6K6_GALM3|nr:hypothetical protein GALMADRAFT_137782 [Galerina marginata CBS 339.88]